MPDRLLSPESGPDSMFSTDLPPSRGQYHAIAVLALKLLEVAPPQHRLDATTVMVRLANAVASDQGPPLPEVEIGF